MALPSHTYNLDDGAETEEDNFDAASCYVGDANEDYEEYAPDRHTPNTPQTNTPTPLAWGPAGFGTLYKEELPNSIKDINVKNTPPPRKSSWSFESDRTVLIPGGTKITPKPQPKYVSVFFSFDCASSKLYFQTLHLSPFLACAPDRAACPLQLRALVEPSHKTPSHLVLRQAHLLLCCSSSPNTTTHVFRPKDRSKGT